MVDIAWLAATVVGKFLVPLFTRGKDQLTEDIAEVEGKAAADGLVRTAGTIWKSIKGHLDHDDERNAASIFQKNPAAMEMMMIGLLEKRLRDDVDFRQQIQRLVEAPVVGTGQATLNLMGEYIGAVDARNSVISEGTVAGVIVHGGPADRPPERGAGS